MQISKSKQLAYRTKRKKPKVHIKESQLQKQCDDYLAINRIKYLRIPNWIWNWLRHNAPIEIMNYMSERFGGMPDNICLIPIGESKYNLALCLELKTETGRIHGKQKQWMKDLHVVISRSPEDTMHLIKLFEWKAEKL